MNEDQIMEHEFLSPRLVRTNVLFRSAEMLGGFDVLLYTYKNSLPLHLSRVELPAPDEWLKWGINLRFFKWELCVYTLTKLRIAEIKYERYKKEFYELEALEGFDDMIEE